MKELKFNIAYLFNKKEFYFGIIGVLLVNIVHIFLVIQGNEFYEMMPKGEYQFILYNTTISLSILVIVVFPILCSMILSDSCWLEKHRKTDNLLYMRLNYRKSTYIRWGLSIIITFVIVFIGFMLNYIFLVLLFGSGNVITTVQSMAYNLVGIPEFFLDSIRMVNPVLFVILLSLHVSFIMGLLSGIAFGLAFFTRQRLVVYFQILLFMIVLEAIFSFIGINALSIIKQLQPFSRFSMQDASILYTVLIVMNVILMFLQYQKKDVGL